MTTEPVWPRGAPSVGDRAERKHPWLYGAGKRLFGGRLRRKLEQERTLLDADLFRRLKRYELMLFRVPDTASG